MLRDIFVNIRGVSLHQRLIGIFVNVDGHRNEFLEKINKLQR